MSDTLLFTVIPFHLLVVLVPISAFVLYKFPQAFHYLLALFLGVLVGYINLHTDEEIFPVLLLIAFGLFLGFTQAKKSWLYVVLLAMWVPLGEFVSLLARHKHTIDFISSMVAFLPASVGVYAGVFLRRASERSSAHLI
jgi:hypothetical protein